MENLNCQQECQNKPVNNFYYGCGHCKNTEGNGTPIIPNIGDNGNWFIGAEDTGVKAQGVDGTSAYQSALENGFVGTELEWLESLKGAAGVMGPQGIMGPAGPKGDKGDKGENGLGFTIDTIYNGELGVKDRASLLKSISDYRMVYVEMKLYCTDESSGWIKSYVTILSPKISTTLYEYGGTHTVLASSDLTETCTYYFHFPTASQIMFDHMSIQSNFTDIKIAGVYGIK